MLGAQNTVGILAHKFLSVEGFMGSSRHGCRLLEFDAARSSRIQFAQHYVISVHGVGITFVHFIPVHETGCPMWLAGLTFDV